MPSVTTALVTVTQTAQLEHVQLTSEDSGAAFNAGAATIGDNCCGQSAIGQSHGWPTGKSWPLNISIAASLNMERFMAAPKIVGKPFGESTPGLGSARIRCCAAWYLRAFPINAAR